MKKILCLVVLISVLAINVHASDNITIPNTFNSGETISSSKMNENFSKLVQRINELTSLLSNGSGGSSDGSEESNLDMIHTQIADAPEAFAQIGNLKFRYNSTEQNGFIEVKTLDSGEHMQVYCSLKRSSWDPGGSNHIENYHNDANYNNSTWNPLIKLWENDAWDGRVTLSSYKTFEGTMFTMGSGGAPPEPKSYRFFANIDGYNNVFIKVEYHE